MYYGSGMGYDGCEYNPCAGYAYPVCNTGNRGGFAIIVVLFILLIIIGACFCIN